MILQPRSNATSAHRVILEKSRTLMEPTPAGVRHSVPNSGTAKQVIASLIVSVSCLVAGMNNGWSSPMALILTTHDSPVGKMTTIEISHLLTTATYVQLPMSLSAFSLANRFGRITTMYISAAGTIVGFWVLANATSVWMLFVGQFISRFCYFASIIGPLYVSECVHYSQRGYFISLTTALNNVGFFTAYVLGKVLNYRWFNTAFVIIAGAFLFLASFLPESPHFLVSQGRLEEAKKSILWLRGGNRHVTKLELESIRSQLSTDQTDKPQKTSFVKNFKNKGARRALVIVTSNVCFSNLSGLRQVMAYTGLIFRESRSFLSAEDSSIIIAALKLTSSMVNVFIVDNVGRKPLMYVTFVTSCITLTILSSFLYFQKLGFDVEGFLWVPVICLGLFVFSYGLGLGTVTQILLNELVTNEVRASALSIGIITEIILGSAAILTFPYLDQFFGLYAVFVLPSLINGVGVFYTYKLIPETRGKSLRQISEELNR